PVRSRLQHFVDRVFDRDRTRYHLAVGEVSDAMVSMLSIREIVQRILTVLTDTMGVRRAMVLMLDEDKQVLLETAARGDWTDDEELVSIPSDHAIEKYLWVRRDPVSVADFEDEKDEEVKAQCREIFERLEIQLLVPILFGADLLGVIAVGEKRSKDRFDRHDRELVGTLANQSAIAIENAKVFDELGNLNETLEARVEERTEALKAAQSQLIHNEKMVGLGQLVAGVAHELNNPIGFVHANIQLIEERIEKLIQADPGSPQAERTRDALAKLLSRSREGTERVKKIVEDLRTFSRLDHAELSEVDLNHSIESTVSLMRPRLRDGVVVEKHYGELPPVRCFSGQLNQVFMNILVNACDAIAGEGVIQIDTERIEEGVRLRFSDSGPGIPEEIRSRIFDPFFTTKEVGKGTGLGLSISHGIIERHGGKIYVEPVQEGTGVSFVVELPLDVAVREGSGVADE
ncbi:MAG: GAF domain-containing protein, partial [Deltaproteobacteria bacterium]|nr:GAF domain-containing protein [Deltaproteobacteria bacterium]